MLQARSSLTRCGLYADIGTSQTMAYECSCGCPPVFPSLALAVSKYPNGTCCSSPDAFSFPCLHCASFFFHSRCLLPLVIDSILSRTKETLAVTEKQKWQLDSYGFKIALHLFSNKTVCASVSLFLSFTLTSSFPVFWPFHPLPVPLVFLVSLPPTGMTFTALFRNSVWYFFDFLHHIPPPLCLSSSPSLLFPFSCMCLSVPGTTWSEPLQWIISQLTHRGQPKPPVQTRDNIQIIGCLALDHGSKPPYQFEPGSVHRSAHKPY